MVLIVYLFARNVCLIISTKQSRAIGYCTPVNIGEQSVLYVAVPKLIVWVCCCCCQDDGPQAVRVSDCSTPDIHQENPQTVHSTKQLEQEV